MKETIIDGVNVAGCEFYDNGCCRECDMRVPFYSDIDCYDKCNKDCYYKQLKLLEQENAELKEELQKYKDMEAKGLEEFKDVGGCWGCGIQLASDQYFNEAKKYFNEAKKYRHTLEEIRRTMQDIIEDNGRHNLSEYSSPIRIEKIVNEVLK